MHKKWAMLICSSKIWTLVSLDVGRKRQQSLSVSTRFTRRAPKTVSHKRTTALRLISLEHSYLITWWTRAVPMMPPALMCSFGVRGLRGEMFRVCINSCKSACPASLQMSSVTVVVDNYSASTHCCLISVKTLKTDAGAATIAVIPVTQSNAAIRCDAAEEWRSKVKHLSFAHKVYSNSSCQKNKNNKKTKHIVWSQHDEANLLG